MFVNSPTFTQKHRCWSALSVTC